VISPRDCVLVKSGPQEVDLPFVAKVAALWENPDDGEFRCCICVERGTLLWNGKMEES
jgi:hypothetical protein